MYFQEFFTINLTSLLKRCGKFHFGLRGGETPQISKFVPKMNFSLEQ